MATQRKPRQFLNGEQKYDLWLKMLTGELTRAEAAALAGVDRSTITKLRAVARDGAIAALQASKPGKPRQSRVEVTEIAGLRVEVERLEHTIVEQAIELAALRAKTSWG